MNNDLISREALKEEFKSRLAKCNEWIEKAKDKETKIRASAVKAFIGEVIMTIDNAPTPFNPTVITCNISGDEETEKLIKAIQNQRLIYVETPHEIPTFNRKELEKARDYWYSHLEVGNEEQNEAAWAAINAIKYCIEHSSGYQEQGGAT